MGGGQLVVTGLIRRSDEDQPTVGGHAPFGVKAARYRVEDAPARDVPRRGNLVGTSRRDQYLTAVADDHHALAAVLGQPLQHIPVRRALDGVQRLAPGRDACGAALPGDRVPALRQVRGRARNRIRQAGTEALERARCEGSGLTAVVDEALVGQASQSAVGGGAGYRCRADKFADYLCRAGVQSADDHECGAPSLGGAARSVRARARNARRLAGEGPLPSGTDWAPCCRHEATLRRLPRDGRLGC